MFFREKMLAMPQGSYQTHPYLRKYRAMLTRVSPPLVQMVIDVLMRRTSLRRSPLQKTLAVDWLSRSTQSRSKELSLPSWLKQYCWWYRP